MNFSTWLILGGIGAAGVWFLFGRKDYFVITDGGHSEYFKDLPSARDYSKAHRGDLYEIPWGSEFSGTRSDPDPRAKRLTPNRRRRSRRNKKR